MRISIGQAVEDRKTRVLDLQVEAGSDDALVTEVVISLASEFQTAPEVRVITTGRYIHKLSGTLETLEDEGVVAPAIAAIGQRLDAIVENLVGDEHAYSLRQAYRERVGWTDMSDPDGLCVLEQMEYEGWTAHSSDAPFVTGAAYDVLQGKYDQVKKRVRDVAGILDILGSSVSETLGHYRNRGMAYLPVSVTTGGPGHTNALHELASLLAAAGVPYLLDNSDLWQRVIAHLVGTLRWMVSDDAHFLESWNMGRARQPVAGPTAKDSRYPPFEIAEHGEYRPGEAAAHGADREPFKSTVPDDARIVPKFMFEVMQALRRKVALAEAGLDWFEANAPSPYMERAAAIKAQIFEVRPGDPLHILHQDECHDPWHDGGKRGKTDDCPTCRSTAREVRGFFDGEQWVIPRGVLLRTEIEYAEALRSDRDMWRQTVQAQAESLAVLRRFVDHMADALADAHRRGPDAVHRGEAGPMLEEARQAALSDVAPHAYEQTLEGKPGTCAVCGQVQAHPLHVMKATGWPGDGLGLQDS